MVLKTLKDFVESELLSGRMVETNENLLLSGLVDSLGVMRLVGFIEKSYGFKVPAADVKLSNFQTLDAIAAYVASRSVL
jgi:acyl carrier protein